MVSKRTSKGKPPSLGGWGWPDATHAPKAGEGLSWVFPSEAKYAQILTPFPRILQVKNTVSFRSYNNLQYYIFNRGEHCYAT